MSERTDQQLAGKRKPWQFMSRFTIKNANGSTYLIRWRIVQTPYASIYLHKFLRPDSDPYVHDHPWAFIALVLRGGYTEVRRNNFTHELKRRHIRFVNVMRRDDAHYIEHIDRLPTWTLLFVGRRRRTWGFWTPQFMWGEGSKTAVPNQTWTEFDNWEGR